MAPRPSCARRGAWTRSPDLAERVCDQITQRLAGEKITDRLVSLADPDARPIGKGKLGKRYEFGYVSQLTELTPNTRRGARGLILPPTSRVGSQRKRAAAEHPRRARASGTPPREVELDGGFPVDAAKRAFAAANVCRRPTTPAIAMFEEATRLLPRRQRGPHQPPQTRLRPAPVTPPRP